MIIVANNKHPRKEREKQMKKNEEHVVTTATKFWEIIENSNFADKECYGYDGLLNSLSLLIGESAKLYRIEGDEKMAEIREKQATRIFKALEELGLYED